MTPKNTQCHEDLLFWDKLRMRLRRVALGLAEKASMSLWMEADDFAHEALVVAIEFFDKQVGSRALTLDERERLHDECYRYARKALRNNFISHIRKEGVHKRALEDYGRLTLIRFWCGDFSRQPTPEDHAIAADLVRHIARAAKLSASETYILIAKTLLELSEEQRANLDTADLAELPGVGPNRRRDFALMLARKLGLTSRGTVQGEVE